MLAASTALVRASRPQPDSWAQVEARWTVSVEAAGPASLRVPNGTTSRAALGLLAANAVVLTATMLANTGPVGLLLSASVLSTALRFLLMPAWIFGKRGEGPIFPLAGMRVGCQP